MYGRQELYNYYDPESYIGMFFYKNVRSTSKTVKVRRVANNDCTYFNTYFSINNVFQGTKRNAKNVSSLNWCFADLDVFHEDDNAFKGLTAKQVYELVLSELCDNGLLPRPTVAVDSGRGLYLLWKINQSENVKNESKCALKRWKRIQKELNTRLINYCADVRICTDCARLLRVPGSVNTKSNTRVDVIDNNPMNTYSLYSLEEELTGVYASDAQRRLIEKIEVVNGVTFSSDMKRDASKFIHENYIKYRGRKYGKASKKQLDYCRDIAKKLNLKQRNFTYYHDADRFIKRYEDAFYNARNNVHVHINKEPTNTDDCYTNMYKKRIAIIEHIIDSEPDQTGHRESLLFLYRYYNLILLDDAKTALNATLELNRRFYHPLSENEVIGATRSSERYYASKNKLKMTTAKFCDMTGISEEEYKNFADATSCIKRKKEINREYYLRKLEKENKHSKKDKISIRREFIAANIRVGKTDDEIMTKYGISESTYYRDKKVVMEQIRRELKEKKEEQIRRIIEKTKMAIYDAAEKSKKLCGKAENIRLLKHCHFFRPLVLYVRSTSRSEHRRFAESYPKSSVKLKSFVFHCT